MRTLPVALVASLALIPAAPGAQANEYDHLVAKHAAAHGVPEALVRRVIQIESRGNPRVVSKGNYGLMQIRLGTARAMGYSGDATGLLDAETNMTYAVRYLAGAYRAAGGNSEQAIRNYQRGYYDRAKAKGFSPYAAASTTQQPAAPDPTLLAQEDARRLAAERKAQERQPIEQERAMRRQAALQAKVEQRRAAELEKAAKRQAVSLERAQRQAAADQQRAAQRQASLQQQAVEENAKQQQRIEREQDKQERALEQRMQPPAPPVTQTQPVAPAPAASQVPAVRRAAPASGYVWYHPMRYFTHPSHRTHPYKHER